MWRLRKTTKTSKVVGKEGVRVSDVYDDVELPYPDCKVAEKLFIEGGPCFILINNSFVESTAMKTFILTKVVANIRQ
jgi:hypothetical protein